MPTLHIALLGDFSLTYDQQVITAVNTARLQALLAYLVLHRNAPQSRRHLAFLLWPDSSEAQARTNLRNLLHLLRQALPMIDNFLQVDTTTIQWRAEAPFTLDLLQFDAALAKAETSGSSTQERTTLETAVRLYQGDLLPACYEDWIQPLREQYRQRLIGALTRLIDLLARQPDAPAAIRYAQRLLRIDPLHETTYQQLMQLYAQIGDRAHALNTYHTCATVLHRELSVPPSAATQAIYHRLKSAPTPQPALPSPTDAPLHRQHNLPLLLTSFVGRKTTIDEIKAALHRSRLVTLTGPGGCGKTRLALAVAADIVDDYPGGVWLVELGALREATHLVATLAATLAVAEEATRPLVDTVIDRLRDQHRLLILDTCEHLIDGCADLVQMLLHACPQLQILATSRERLAVAGELVWPVPPLTMPPLERPATSAESIPIWLQQYEAVQLLVERIQAVLPTFTVTQQTAPALAQLAVHLDGLPLALELAAARAVHLSVPEIAAHLDQRFHLLRSGARDAIPRHQTLAAALDWSYDRLSPVEQMLLRRLAIFDSTFTLAAAQSICTDQPVTTADALLAADGVLDLLAHLVDKSLVTVSLQPGGTTRYGLLETIRAYGYERLAADNEVTTCRQRHLRFFTELAEAAEPHLRQHDQVEWLDQLEAEQENLRAALSWALTPSTTGEQAEEQIGLGLRLGGALWRFWIYRSHYSEGSSHLTKLLAAAAQSPVAASAAYAKVLLGAGCLVGEQGEYNAAQHFLEQALARYQALALPAGIAEATYSLAWLANWRGDVATARPYYETSIALYQQLNDATGLAWALRGLAWMDRTAGDLVQAESRIRESLHHFQVAGDLVGLSFAWGGLAYVALDRGDYAASQHYAEQSLAYARQVGDQLAVSRNLRLLGHLARKTGRHREATALYHESLTICRTLNDQYGIAQNYQWLGEAALALGDLAQATHDFQAAYDYYQVIDYQPGLAWLLLSTGDLARQQGDYTRATQDYKTSRQLGETIQQPWLVTAAQERLASLPTPDFPRNV